MSLRVPPSSTDTPAPGPSPDTMPGTSSSSSSSSPLPNPASPSAPGRPKSQGDRPSALSPRVSWSKQQRLQEILEIGQARAERTRSCTSEPSPRHQNDPATAPRRMEPLLGRGGDGASSEDEDGGGRSRRNTRRAPLNYQTATAASTVGINGRQDSRGGGGGSHAGSVYRRPAAGHSEAGSSPRPPPTANGNNTHDGAAGQAGGGVAAWLKSTVSSFGSVELENKGSVARDHLALERTFLAWLRTSVSFASIGIAVTQLFRLSTSLNNGGSPTESQEQLRKLGKPLGAAFLCISILILFLGYARFARGQRWIMVGKFPASRGTVIVVTLLTFAAMVASLAIVLAFAPGGVD
ncbi:hypothetical protein RB595_000919 [Gaeumannomyces hyphopodioides]